MLKSSFITAVMVAALVAPALAQSDTPNGSGVGLQRGLETLNASGQVGMVTILRSGGTPMLSINVKGSKGHPEAVTLARGKDCSDVELDSVMPLGRLKDGHLSATSPVSGDHLLSGNYNVLVHNNTSTSQPVACSHLFIR